MAEPLAVWGPELSPFLLKLESMLVHAGIRFRRLPRDGTRAESFAASRNVARAIQRRTALRPPANDPLDEYPLVPYLLAGDDVLFDSSALAPWIDAKTSAAPLVPEDPATRFVCRFLDEAFDEIGLYLVHHNRWKLAAGNNDRPGRRLAAEYRTLLPPKTGPLFAAWFERRQVRRLPYLFSVAPEGYRVIGLPRGLTPPSVEGFPPTHEILEETWQRTLAAMESVLSRQPWLFGGRFTLADASAYGQLSMNLTDTAAAIRLRELAPRTFEWLTSIRDRAHAGTNGDVFVSDALAPLLGVMSETFAPLMRANERAWRRYAGAGATTFNERGFDERKCLFAGELLGRPYRSVVKTFQVRVWRDLRRDWEALDPEAKQEVRVAFAGADPDRLFCDPEGAA